MSRPTTVTALIVALMLLPGCAATKKEMTNIGMTTPELTTDLTKNLGVNAAQATGGVGAMLQAASEKLNAADMKTITDAVPGANNYMQAAQKALGGAKISELGGVQGAFKKLGLSPDMVDKFKPPVLDYVGKYSPTARGLLSNVL